MRCCGHRRRRSSRRCARGSCCARRRARRNTEIASEVGVSLPTVGLWRRNFSSGGLDGLETAPRSGRPREIDDDEVAAGARQDA